MFTLLIGEAQAEAWRLRGRWPGQAKGPQAQKAAWAASVVGTEGGPLGGSKPVRAGTAELGGV